MLDLFKDAEGIFMSRLEAWRDSSPEVKLEEVKVENVQEEADHGLVVTQSPAYSSRIRIQERLQIQLTLQVQAFFNVVRNSLEVSFRTKVQTHASYPSIAAAHDFVQLIKLITTLFLSSSSISAVSSIVIATKFVNAFSLFRQDRLALSTCHQKFCVYIKWLDDVGHPVSETDTHIRYIQKLSSQFDGMETAWLHDVPYDECVTNGIIRRRI